MAVCKCGCGSAVKRGRAFVDKEHQLAWMNAGGAREMNALQPLEAKIKGGSVAGRYRSKLRTPAPNKELDN